MSALDNSLIAKLAESLRKNNRLEKLIKQFKNQYGLLPCIGVEIEFFLSKNIQHIEFQKMLGMIVKTEKGDNQFEIDLPPSTNLLEYIEQIKTAKKNIIVTAQKLGGIANLQAKPFINDYGSSMHFHINFFNNFSGSYSSNEIIDQAARSLCHYMLDSFLVFLPNDEDYLRLDNKFMAPTHVSFGGNNRTVSVRLPDLSPRRLEHRLSCPLTDPYIALFTILKSILLGWQSPANIPNIPKIYGNAYDAQYNLKALPISKDAACKLFKTEFFVELLIDA